MDSSFLLNKWIVEAAMIDKNRYVDGADEYKRRNCQRRIIPSRQFFGCVPGTGFALGKTAQIHGVADEFNAVQRGKN